MDEPSPGAGAGAGAGDAEATGGGADGAVALSEVPAGRRLLNLLAVVLLGAMVISNLPSSALRDELRLLERPITDLTGLSQNWALFAPNPRSTVLRLRAEIERADGSVTEWIPPVGDRLISTYRTYRWRKWGNGVAAPDASRLHRGAAHHLRARFERADEAPIVEIRLYRGTFRQPRPGSGEPADRSPDFDEELLYRAVTPADDEEAGA